MATATIGIGCLAVVLLVYALLSSASSDPVRGSINSKNHSVVSDASNTTKYSHTNSVVPTSSSPPLAFPVEKSSTGSLLNDTFRITRSSSSSTKSKSEPTTTKGPKVNRKFQNITLDSSKDWENHTFHICNSSFKTILTLNCPDPHKFELFPENNEEYSCPDRVYGLSFLNSHLHLDQTTALLNSTTELRLLMFSGPSICEKNIGVSITKIDPISLEHLSSLTFENLISPGNNAADCAPLYFLMASKTKVKDIALKSLSFHRVIFSPMNQKDVHQLVWRSFSSRRVKELSILGVLVNEEMFNITVPARNLNLVRFHAKNKAGKKAELSLGNMINQFLKDSKVEIFETNIPLPYKIFRASVKVFDKMEVERLRIAVYPENCQSFSFEFLNDIPHILSLDLTLRFSKSCKNEVQNNPIIFERLNYLEYSKNYVEFKVRSNARFLAPGVSDLHCRNFTRTLFTLELNRVSDC